MKPIKTTLSILTILAINTFVNANDRCNDEIGNVFGERDRVGQNTQILKKR